MCPKLKKSVEDSFGEGFDEEDPDLPNETDFMVDDSEEL